MEKQFAKFFSILSDLNRLKIYSYLLYKPEGLYVCELSNLLGMPYYTVSKSLKELETAGLIESQRYGKYILYFPFKTDNKIILKLNSLILDIANSSNYILKEEIEKTVNNRNKMQCLCDNSKD